MRRSLDLLIIVAGLAAARHLGAQAPAPAGRFGSPAMCRRAAASPLVLVTFNPPPPGGAIGPLLACDSLGVTIGPYAGGDGQEIGVAGIRKLSVRTGSGLSWAVWGGLLGGLGGYVIGSSRSHLCAPPPYSGATDTGCHGNVVAPTALGLVTGAALGWFFGRGIPTWKVIYRMAR